MPEDEKDGTNNLENFKADLNTLRSHLFLISEFKKFFDEKIEDMQIRYNENNLNDMLHEISIELDKISIKTEDIKTIVKTIKGHALTKLLKIDSEDHKIETMGKLRVVPLEKLITKTLENDVNELKKNIEKEYNSRNMHSNDKIECLNISETNFLTKDKMNTINMCGNTFFKKCIVRLKRVQTKSSGQNNIQKEKVQTTKLLVTNNASNSKDADNMINEEYSNGNEISSGSEISVAKTKKRLLRNSSTSSTESNLGHRKKKTKELVTKKRRISSPSDSSDDEINKKRKNIRKLINSKNLEDDTKRATYEEEKRRKRIEERQKMYNQILFDKTENLGVEELILDFIEDTKQILLEVDKGLLKKLKPHQVNGVKFMWDACFETVKACQEKKGSGCILAHCMGLGKTLQIVTLTHTLLVNNRVTNVGRVLIISPLSTLSNWAREYMNWIKFAKNKEVEVYDMSKYKDKNTRAFKLEEWFKEGGICIVGYDMFRILSNAKTKGLRKKLKETLQKSLVDPGPDLVVCDEGHLLKNEKTSLSQAVTKMKTKRRIVLTGTPLQNNLKEYYCMIQFIKPNLLGTYKEYLNRFVNPITNGQYTDSTERDIRLMKHRSHILHKMLEGCIQRQDYSVLAPYLPPKHEYVIFVTLSDIQKKLYSFYMTNQRQKIGETCSNSSKGTKLFQDFQYLRRIWTHPMNLKVNSDTLIRKKLARYDSDDSIKDFINDSDEVTSSDSEAASSNGNEINKVAAKDIEEFVQDEEPSEWWTKIVDEDELNNINHSPKLVMLMTLLQQCECIGDKVLVFSQSLQSLDVIEHFLRLIDEKTKGLKIDGNVAGFKGCWVPGVDYFRLDGSRTVENRDIMCRKFNDIQNVQSRLFLISTKAGGLGINLVAANRVIIFDVSWNPSHDTQSIFRVYRFGQLKPCYIYRLIALGTMEEKVYERQVIKQATAKRVIDEQQISRHYNQSDLLELYSYELNQTSQREIPKLPKDRLFAELLSDYKNLIFKYHEHDSLLEVEESQNLSEEERKAAWSEYEAEKNRPQLSNQYLAYDRQNCGNYGNASGSLTSNKIFGIRSDILLRLLNIKITQEHPGLSNNQVITLVPSYLQKLYAEMNNGNPSMYKDLLAMHSAMETASGIYMNPLLYANQNPSLIAIASVSQANQRNEHNSIGPAFLNTNEVYEID